jgi:hypothetical protein
VRKVRDWLNEQGPDAQLDYLFVSYTRRHFYTKEERGKAEIRKIGEDAARRAKTNAFWIDFDCTPGKTQAQDIHRICDIVRGAHSLVVAIASPRDQLPLDTRALLHQWGSRIWTLPELLLCPSEHKIDVYVLGSQVEPQLSLAKRNFAVIAWDDAKAVRQLIDHFEGSLILTPLELVTIALDCLQYRLAQMKDENEYTEFASGDLSYALMGLLRRRPEVNMKDTNFEAFARLSLANDSNMLLERLISMLPPNRESPWHIIEDAWGVKLWDLTPTCQVSGIGDNQTVILDGAHGATIRWKSLAPVAFSRRKTFYRDVMKIALRGSPLWFIIGLITLATGASAPHFGSKLNPAVTPGLVIFLLAMIVVLTSPVLLLATYRGKFWGTQSWFFGIEGYVDIGTLESSLFGINLGRLKWSTNGSMLSDHHIATGCRSVPGECEPLIPPDAANLVSAQPVRPPWYSFIQRRRQRQPEGVVWRIMPQHDGQERLFTLVDTCSMTVTLFRARRPPVAVIVCGSEGGMQRAVLCSYDWRTQTFCRETVLRMKTMVTEKMFRVDRFRFSLFDGYKFRQDVVEAEARRAAEKASGPHPTSQVDGAVPG